MKLFAAAVVIVLISSPAFAQSTRSASTRPAQTRTADADVSLATPLGHEVHVSFGGYKYTEPGDLSISIHGPKFGGGYTGTWSLNRNQHWFATADAHALVGSTTYDGFCYPFLLTPDSTSPNGYLLDI